MIIIPSLDIQNGLSKYPFDGNYSPIEIVRNLKKKGFHHFLLTDLDGVFAGEFVNYDLISELKSEGISLYVGGGIRSFDIATRIMTSGADAIVIGTIAIKDQELLMDLLETYNDQLYVAIDTYEDSVFIEGWVEDSDVDVSQFIASMALLGVKKLIHTEINHVDNLTICSSDIMHQLSEEHHIKITPGVDISKTILFDEFIRCGCKEVIVGGSLDMLDLDNYKKYNV
jgi:phosphoribosylformimino-5-aminoimidazole carboxamide ribotide isomerase